MKTFTAKTIEEAVAEACAELNVSEKTLSYEVKEEKKGLFKKSATINVFDKDDVAEYAVEYIKKSLYALGVQVSAESVIEEDIIKITIDSDHNPILIGRNGKTLQALNELTKLAVSNKFRHRHRILLDVGGYKEDKYSRVERIARRAAREVIKTKVDVQLDPMTPDERRVVHGCLSKIEHIKTESTGEGPSRAVCIKYVD